MTKEQKQLNGGWTAFSINGAGEIEIHQQKKKKKERKKLDLKKSHFMQNCTENKFLI